MFFDGALNNDGAGASVIFKTPINDVLWYVFRIHFLISNSATEYEAYLHGLPIVVELSIKCLMVRGDSVLVINQLNKDWSCTNEKMDAYCAKIKRLEGKFLGIEYHHVVWDQNQLANQLSKLGSSRSKTSLGVFIQDLFKPSIDPEQEIIEAHPPEELVMTVPSLTNDWRDQFIKYLTKAKVPNDKIETECLICQSKHYVLVIGQLMPKNSKEEIL